MKNTILFATFLSLAASAQAQTLPTGVNVVPFYDVNKAGLSFKVDQQSLTGIYEVPGKPQHFVVVGYFGYLWTLFPDTTKTYAAGAIKDYKKKEVGNFNDMVMKGHEQGAQGGAFDPWFKKNRYFYVIYNKYASASSYHSGVKPNGQDGYQNAGLVVVDRWKFAEDFATMTRDTTIFVAQHGKGYGASNMEFGSDGMLYISPNGYNWNGWDSTTFMRKVLRIDVRNPEGGRMYTIPTDNPFYKSANPLLKKEIFALGFRNTYNLKADHLTGKIWGGEVGEGDWEEVNIIEAGKNYGWANGGDYASVGYMSIGIEGPCSPSGQALTSNGGADTSKTNSQLVMNPFSRVYRGQTFTCADLTNATWSFSRTGKEKNGSKPALDGTTMNNVVVSPAFRGDPTSPFFGYHFISDVKQKYFIAVKEGVAGAKNVGGVTGMTFSGDQTHNGLTNFGEDSYGNLYVTFVSSNEAGALQWHDIYRMNHEQLKPLTTPRPQVHPIDPSVVSLQSGRDQANRPISMWAAGGNAPWLRLPAGASEAELYDLGGRKLWHGRGVSGSTLAVPSGLAKGAVWVRYLP
ncbi:MAG: PQQ-dependent sugar dehydrogenase [Fibrobacteria bacterium]